MLKSAHFDSSLNLYEAGDHSSLKVLSISGGWDIRRSFNQLGIHAGDHVQILHRAPFGGPLVIENGGSRVAIGKQLAEKIQVQVLP